MSTVKLLYVYILRCSDGSYYVGITNDVEVRVEQHNEGGSNMAYTNSRRPVELMYVEEYADFEMAIAREKQLKRWTRQKKEVLIAGKYDALRKLAACKNETSHLKREENSRGQIGG